MEGERSYVGELAHSIGFDSDVVLLELLFDLVDACGDVLGLGADKGEGKQQTPDQIRWTDIRRRRLRAGWKILIFLLSLSKTLTKNRMSVLPKFNRFFLSTTNLQDCHMRLDVCRYLQGQI